MTCDEAMNSVLDYVLLRAYGETERESPLGAGVIEHIAGCTRCLEELRALGFLVTGEKSEDLGSVLERLRCQVARERMLFWLGMGLRLTDTTSDYREEWQHVQACARCSEEYRGLLEAMESGPPPVWEEREGVRRLQTALSLPVLLTQVWRGNAPSVSCAGSGGQVAKVLDYLTGLQVSVNAVQSSAGTLDVEVVVTAPGNLAELGVPEFDLVACEPGGEVAVRAVRTRGGKVRGVAAPEDKPKPVTRVRGDAGETQVEYRATFQAPVGTGAFFIRIRGAGKTWELPLSLEAPPGSGCR